MNVLKNIRENIQTSTNPLRLFLSHFNTSKLSNSKLNYKENRGLFLLQILLFNNIVRITQQSEARKWRISYSRQSRSKDLWWGAVWCSTSARYSVNTWDWEYSEMVRQLDSSSLSCVLSVFTQSTWASHKSEVRNSGVCSKWSISMFSERNINCIKSWDGLRQLYRPLSIGCFWSHQTGK